MLAGIESAACFPHLSLITFATSSHAACLREEITTLAPCSAIRSAIARPIPRDEPVMTATFPDKSNKVMSHSLGNYGLRQLGLHDLRSRRLMHRLVRCIRNPWLLVHHRQTPGTVPRACEMIEPRHRAIIDIEGKTFLGLAAKGKPDRRLDRAAMTNRNHVMARVLNIDALDRAADAVVQVQKTFAA